MGIFSSLFGNAGVANPDELNKDYANLLTEGELIEIGFKLVWDTFIFTMLSPFSYIRFLP